MNQVACDLTAGLPAGSRPQEEEEREKLILKKYKASILELIFTTPKTSSLQVWRGVI